MTPSEAAQTYALALPGVWHYNNNGSFAHLGGKYASPSHRRWARGVLDESWGIKDKASLLDRIKWLHEKGHSSEYFEWKKKWHAEPASRESDLRLIHVGVFQAEIGDKGLVAWDQSRCINVAGWGFLAGYITEEEAWDHIIPAAQKIQKAYGSWAEYGRGYMVGTAFWSAPAAEKNGQASDALLADPNSPWSRIPWNTPLGAGSSAAAASGGGVMAYAMYAVGCLLLLALGGGLAAIAAVVVAVVGAGAFWGVARAPGPDGAPVAAAAASGDWDGKTPFVCKGNEVVALSGMDVKLGEGPAVLAKGNCVLTLHGMTIDAPVAVRSEANAEITVNGGKLVGSKNAVEAAGNSKVHLVGTAVNGNVDRKGGAKVDGP